MLHHKFAWLTGRLCSVVISANTIAFTVSTDQVLHAIGYLFTETEQPRSFLLDQVWLTLELTLKEGERERERMVQHVNKEGHACMGVYSSTYRDLGILQALGHY